MSAPHHLQPRPWLCSGGEPSRSGCFPHRLDVERQPFRKLRMQGAIQASVLFDSFGRALVADMTGCLRGFSPNGTVDWSLRLDAPVSATGAVDEAGGRFFVGTHSGSVWAIQSANGSVLWHVTLPTKSDARILSNLLYHANLDMVVLSSWGGSFVGLEAKSGKILASWEAGFYPQCGVTATDSGTLYFPRAVKETGCQIVCRPTPDTEKVLLQEPEPVEGSRRVTTTAEVVLDATRRRGYFLCNGNRKSALHSWDLDQGKAVWTASLDRFVLTTPALAPDGSVYVTDLTGALRRFSPNGELQWRYDADCDFLLASPVCDAWGTVYFGDPLGRVHVVNAEGKGRAVYEAPRSVQARPSFDGQGNLYVPCTDGQIYLFRNRAGLG